jgi:predicted nucleic acid-binding protein
VTNENVVVDASVIVTLLIDPGAAGESIAVRLAATHLHAPDHLAVEVTNVLRRRRNSGLLSETEARLALDGLGELAVQRWPLEILAERCWELGDSLSSYDAAYVALAEHLGAVLLTADARLSRAPGPSCAVEVFAP